MASLEAACVRPADSTRSSGETYKLTISAVFSFCLCSGHAGTSMRTSISEVRDGTFRYVRGLCLLDGRVRLDTDVSRMCKKLTY